MKRLFVCGGRGIRTPGPAERDNGFQDRRVRPLCHSSGCKTKTIILSAKNYLKKMKTKIISSGYMDTEAV